MSLVCGGKLELKRWERHVLSLRLGLYLQGAFFLGRLSSFPHANLDLAIAIGIARD